MWKYKFNIDKIDFNHLVDMDTSILLVESQVI